MKKKKVFIGPVALVIVGIFALWYSLITMKNSAIELDEEIEEQKNIYIGQKLIVGGDTLIITDYSLFRERCYLSNGTHVSKRLADKQLVPEKIIKE